MARCRYCGSSGWRIRTNSVGLCKPCGKVIHADTARRMKSIKESLLYIRCTKNSEALLPLCEGAIEKVQGLLDYENRKVLNIKPKPSTLLAMLEAKREEVLLDLQASQAPSKKEEAPPGLETPSAEVPEQPPPKPQTAKGKTEAGPGGIARDKEFQEDKWWAWDLTEERLRSWNPVQVEDASDDRRRAPRARVHCLVLLQPGGIRATLENLSKGGLCLRAPRLRAPGNQVRLLLSTPQGPVQAEGIVRWIRRDGTTSDGTDSRAGMGIEFTHISAELRAYLDSRLPCAEMAGSPHEHAPSPALS